MTTEKEIPESDRVFFRGMADQFESHFGNAEDTLKGVVHFFCYIAAGACIESKMSKAEAYGFTDVLLRGCARNIEAVWKANAVE